MCDNIDILTTKFQKGGGKNFFAFWRGVSKKAGKQNFQKWRGQKGGNQDFLKKLEGEPT